MTFKSLNMFVFVVSLNISYLWFCVTLIILHVVAGTPLFSNCVGFASGDEGPAKALMNEIKSRFQDVSLFTIKVRSD